MTATLDDAAGAVGVGPGTLYRHFPTRAAVMNDGLTGVHPLAALAWVGGQLKHDAAQRRRLLSVVIDGPHTDEATMQSQQPNQRAARVRGRLHRRGDRYRWWTRVNDWPSFPVRMNTWRTTGGYPEWRPPGLPVGTAK
jgi:AcrR family transcriptional regulator